MAEKDKEEWLRFFYNILAFEPLKELRAKKSYARRIAFREVLDIGAQIDCALLVHIITVTINPLQKDAYFSIVVLPQWLPTEEGKILEVEKPILYNDEFFSLNDFIAYCPESKYGINIDGIQDIFCFSLSYLLLTTQEKVSFNQKYLTSLRSKIVKTGFEVERRHGRKIEVIEKERKKFILEQLMVLKGKFYTFKRLYEEIRDCVYLRAKEKYPNFNTNKEEMKLYKNFCCEIGTIRNIVGSNRNYLKKK